MALSQGPASGLPGLTLKAWGLVNTSTNTVIKGFNVASVSGGNVTFTAPMASVNYVLRVIYMGSSATVNVGEPSTVSVAVLRAIAVSGGVGQNGLFYFEVYE